MKKILLKTMLLLCALVVGSSAWGQSTTTLFHETFGNNSSSARAWSNDYSVKTGVSTVYSDATYTITEAKQSKNTFGYGSSSSALVSNQGKVGTFIVGPLDVSSYDNLAVTNYFGMSSSSWNTTNSYMKLSYSTGNSTYVEVTRSGSNPSSAASSNSNLVQASYTLPAAAQSSTLYLKFEFYCYQVNKNSQQIGQLYFDEVNLSGVLASTDPSSDAAFTNTTPSINFPATKTYTQTATTASGYTGTVTYAITDNTAGATIDSSTGDVTVTQGGSVTVKATAPAVTGFTKSEATYTLTVNDTRTEPGLAWSATTAEVTYGATDNVFPTLTNTHNVPVTYSSTNETAATIDPTTGVITLNDVTATTSIKAVFAGNDDYLEETVSYTLNVKKGPFAIKDGVFDFVGAASADPFEDYGSGMTLSSSSYTTTNKTWTAGNVTMVTSRVSGNGYRWWEDDGTLRFYNASKATFSVPSGYVITKIETTGANFNSANPSGLSGGTWSGASNEVALTATATKNIKTITVTYTTASQNGTITPAGWASYSCAYPLDLSTLTDGFTAYYASEVEDGKVTLTSTTAKVPAGEGLMIKGTAGETFSVNVAASGTAISGNLLKGQLTTSEVAASAGGTYHYVFGYKTSDATEYGFYNLASATSVPAGKAYLETTASLAAARLDMVFDNATAIEEVENTQAVNGKYYDLQGRFVAQPTKGLYIVNGKKVFIK